MTSLLRTLYGLIIPYNGCGRRTLYTPSTKPLICACDDPDGYLVIPNEDFAKYCSKFEVIPIGNLESDPMLADKVMGLISSPFPTPVSKARKWIPHMPNLKAIVCLASGYDHIYQQLKEFNIPFANSPSVHSDATADHAMALLLAAGCGLMSGLRVTKFAEKPTLLPPSYRCAGVSGTSLGILGMGGIGSAIARRARGFEMNVYYHNRRKKNPDQELALGATFCPTLNDMLPRCDYIVASCNLSDETQYIFRKEQFRLMKSTAIFVNISRGKVVDTDALVDALRNREIAQAALDVTDPEPLPTGHPLLGMDNVILTPHVGPFSKNGINGCLKSVNKNLEAAILNGKKMPNEITE